MVKSLSIYTRDNQRLHSYTFGCSPLFAYYAQDWKTPMIILAPKSMFESVNQMVQETNEVIKFVELRMRSAQDRNKTLRR